MAWELGYEDYGDWESSGYQLGAQPGLTPQEAAVLQAFAMSGNPWESGAVSFPGKYPAQGAWAKPGMSAIAARLPQFFPRPTAPAPYRPPAPPAYAPQAYAPPPPPRPLGAPAQAPFAVRVSEPNTPRVFMIGFKSSADIAALSSGSASASPQDTFAPRKVMVPATVAPNFEITDIRIGVISQLSSVDPVPAEAFLPDSVNADVKFDTAQVSQQITFAVTNVSAAPVRFRAAMNGFVIR